MTTVTVDQKNEPLAVLLFLKAMEEEKTLRTLAQEIGLGPVSLRQIMTGETQRPRSNSLTLLSQALGISVEDVRESYEQAFSPQPTFSSWLTDYIETHDIPRARITRDTHISDSALRNYLSGQTLPDSHQAMRIANALDVSPILIARMVMADLVRDAGFTVPEAVEEVESVADDDRLVDDLMPEMVDAVADEVSALAVTASVGIASSEAVRSYDEEHLLGLWRRLHPQGRRATLIYIAGLLVEG